MAWIRPAPPAEQRILRALIEEFGGEATCAAMCHELTGRAPVPGQEEPTLASIRAALESLSDSGAVALEATTNGTYIARLTREGAMRDCA